MLKLRDLKLQPIPAVIPKIHAQPLKNKKMTAESHQPDPKVTSPLILHLRLVWHSDFTECRGPI